MDLISDSHVPKYAQIADIFPNGIEVGSVLDDYMRLGGPTGAYGERLWKAVP